MTMAAFQDAASEYAAAGIVPLPIDGKKPLVSHPDRFGRRAALQIAAKPQFANAGLGFWCGHHNGLTVADIDDPKDAALQYVLDTFGASPIIVRTASRKHHVWYRHGGERRSIRPIKGQAIDILGEGGLAVAPPSTGHAGGRYEFLRGGLSDLANLPTIRSGVLQKLEPANLRVNPRANDNAATIDHGQRNDRLFKLAVALAHEATTKAELLNQLRKANAALCKPPMLDAEVQGRVRSAWGYKLADRLMVSGTNSTILLSAASIARLLAAGETDAMALLALLRKAHAGLRDTFAASPEAMVRARLIGSWDKRRYRHAARKLCDLGELVQVHRGGKGARDPALYRFAEGGRFAPQY
jgi:hypothetical protein